MARKGAHGQSTGRGKEMNSVAGILMDDGLNSLNDRIANMNVQSNNTMGQQHASSLDYGSQRL